MGLVRVIAPLARRHEVVALAREHVVLFSCSDADTIIATASIASSFEGPFGVWLSVDEQYASQFAARDLATLSWLGPLAHGVIDAPEPVTAHVEVVRALLTNDEVSISNEAATITRAFNRPAPPSPITLWHVEGDALVGEGQVLRERRRETTELGALTYFE